jgi:spore coat polysaccharide biosynthesis protein SpsF
MLKGVFIIIDKIIVATSNKLSDIAIINTCKNYNLNFFVGSEKDVLSRYYFCAKKNKADFVVRITSDCPFVDRSMINKVIKKGLITNADYTSNIHPLTVADGFDVEFIKFKALKTFIYSCGIIYLILV